MTTPPTKSHAAAAEMLNPTQPTATVAAAAAAAVSAVATTTKTEVEADQAKDPEEAEMLGFAQSAALSPGDVTVQQAKDRLQTLVDALPEDEREPAEDEAAVAAAAAAPSNPAAKTPEELMNMDPAEAMAASMPAAAMQSPEEMMRSNPGMAAAAQKMAAENPDMMAKMQGVMMKSGVAPGAAASNPAAMQKMQKEMAKEMASNLDMAESMKSMVSSMPAEARQEMMKVRFLFPLRRFLFSCLRARAPPLLFPLFCILISPTTC